MVSDAIHLSGGEHHDATNDGGQCPCSVLGGVLGSVLGSGEDEGVVGRRWRLRFDGD